MCIVRTMQLLFSGGFCSGHIDTPFFLTALVGDYLHNGIDTTKVTNIQLL